MWRWVDFSTGRISLYLDTSDAAMTWHVFQRYTTYRLHSCFKYKVWWLFSVVGQTDWNDWCREKLWFERILWSSLTCKLGTVKKNEDDLQGTYFNLCSTKQYVANVGFLWKKYLGTAVSSDFTRTPEGWRPDVPCFPSHLDLHKVTYGLICNKIALRGWATDSWMHRFPWNVSVSNGKLEVIKKQEKIRKMSLQVPFPKVSSGAVNYRAEESTDPV